MTSACPVFHPLAEHAGKSYREIDGVGHARTRKRALELAIFEAGRANGSDQSGRQQYISVFHVGQCMAKQKRKSPCTESGAYA